MATYIEGSLEGRGLKVAIVVSRFNEFVTGKLLDGALDALARHGVDDGDITVVRVPGALEIPPAARILAGSGVSAVICLGAVIRGETPHFDFVAAEVSKGISQLALAGPVPVINAVLTTDNVDQAVNRAGAKSGNKGFAAAQNAIEMARVLLAIGGKARGKKADR